MFFLFIYFIFLPPAASVPPLDHDKVTDLDLVKNANRIFPYYVLSHPPFSHSNVLIFCKALPKRHSFANPGDSAKSFSGVEFQTLRLYLNRMKQK